ILSSSYTSQNNIYLSDKRSSIVKNFNSLSHNQCFKIQYYKNGLDTHFEGNISNSNLQSVIIEAIRNYKLENYDKVISILNHQIDLDCNSYYYERKINLLYYSLLNLKLLKESLELRSEEHTSELQSRE